MKKVLEVADRIVKPRFVETSPCMVYIRKIIPQLQDADPDADPEVEIEKDVQKRPRYVRPHGLRRS